MIYVFFIYGLAFFTLGLSTALYPKRGSSFRFAAKLRYVAAFGILHGLNEWVDMFILIEGADAIPYVRVIRAALLGSSFFCLLLFGTGSIARALDGRAWLRALPFALLLVWAGIMAVRNGQWALMSDIWGRYLLGAPGIFLTAYAFVLQGRELKQLGQAEPKRYLSLSAGVFFLYGLLSGMIVPEADFFPASILNYTVFMEHVGVPVQVFRAACAVVAAYCMFKVLQIFHWEARTALKEAHDNLERRVEERTADLRDANTRLESEITERMRAEAFNKDILENVDEAFVVIDPEYSIVTANRAYCKQTGWPMEDIQGRHCFEISHGLDVPCYLAGEECAARHTFETGQPFSTTHIHKNINGDPVYVETKTFPMHGPTGKLEMVIETINDITEKRKLEQQLRHSQKLEAIGTLTGGIAHDFNNILTTIIGYGEFLHDEVPADSPLQVYVDMILASSERAANLTQSLLAFSRKQVTNPKVMKVSDLFQGIEALLLRLMGDDIRLAIETQDKGMTVRVDMGQIEQVLLNLASNARDAMPDGGLLSIVTDLVELESEFVGVHGYGKAGRYCLILVSDTGSGMDEKTREQVFEPFFTTKDVGKGTGLGLAMAYGIIRQHDGFIDVYSEPGQGTTFKVYLPLVNMKPDVEGTLQDISAAGGTETILVAEDNLSIRSLIKEVLERAGYKTILAEDGEDALRLFRENPGQVQLLLLDVIMPKMDGNMVFDEAKKISEDIKILFMSGYSEDVIHKKGILVEGMNFILKPVSPRKLLKKVRSVLDQ